MSAMQEIFMSAIVPEGTGGPEVLRLCSRPVPEPGPGQVLIRVAWAGINPHDRNQRRRGTWPQGETDILGLEVSGTVTAVGAEVPAARIGESVCALIPGGGYAEYAVADAGLALPVPEGMDMRMAACLPEALFTVWLNLMELGQLSAGETLLIHGGTGNIGSVATQFACLRGARVIVTVGDAAKIDLCRRLGADAAIEYRQADWPAQVLALTEGRGVDLVLDATVRYATENLVALAPDGRILQLSSGEGGSFCLPLGLITKKRARLTGAQLRPLPLPFKRRIAEKLRSEVWPHLGTRITPLVDRSFNLTEAAAAHAYSESGGGIGKIVLRCATD